MSALSLSLSLLGAITPSLQSVKRSPAISQDMERLFAAVIKRRRFICGKQPEAMSELSILTFSVETPTWHT